MVTKWQQFLGTVLKLDFCFLFFLVLLVSDNRVGLFLKFWKKNV